jgi:uncharacterized protein YfbU (UPF0304 family)
MKLSLVERVILANQFEILALVKPTEAKYYQYKQRALECGYEGEYEQIAYHFTDGLSAEQCKEVVDILQMHRVLKQEYARLPDKGGVPASAVEFNGFDGNNETVYMGYTRYFCDDPTGGRFDELARPDDFNSHREMLPRYRQMLGRWEASRNKMDLSLDDIKRIVA